MVHMLRKKITLFFVGFVLLFSMLGCSTARNTAFSRAYHQLVVRYNLFFNAQQTYDELLRMQTERFEDDFSELIPLFPFVRIVEKTQPGGPFDGVVERMERAIRHHSIPSETGREYNPMMSQVWLLLGKAHVQNQDYDKAFEVFSHVKILFADDREVVYQARAWILRIFVETGRLHEAEQLAERLMQSELSIQTNELFINNYTTLLLTKGDFVNAIPYLKKAIEVESNSFQRRRLQFLLGQTLAKIGDQEAAFHAFGNVLGLRTPHRLALNAIIQQSIVAPLSQKQQIMSELHRQSHRVTNRNYLDHIHYAIGTLYLQQHETEKAIHHFKIAETEPNNSRFRALAQIALADLFFEKRDFIAAEKRYAEAVALLRETDEAYNRSMFRAEILGELVPRLLLVAEQDSLQLLASLPPDEQRQIIYQHITERRERERAAEREAQLTNQFAPLSSPSNPIVAQPFLGTESAFYFFNPQLVAQGRSEFQLVWGNRPLEDNWRIQNRQTMGLIEQEEARRIDSMPTFEQYSFDYFFHQLPTTPEALEESNRLIAQALYEIGIIAKEQLGDVDFSNQAFDRLVNEFPMSEYAKKVNMWEE